MRRALKSTILIVLIVAVTATLTFAGAAAQTKGSPSAAKVKASLNKAPQAVFPQMRFEFDPVFEGTEIKHDFVVENKGQAPLVIKNIRPD